MAVLQATMSAKSKRNPREESSLKINASPKPAKKVLLIAQDVKFARALSHNDNKIRDRALKRLKKWFVQRYAAHCKYFIGNLCKKHKESACSIDGE